MNPINLIIPKYCLGFQYLSHLATDIHFSISFGATVIYKAPINRNFLERLFNALPSFQEVNFEKITLGYFRRRINWFRMEDGSRATTEEELALNHVKNEFADKLFLGKVEAIKLSPSVIGKKVTFKRNIMEVFLGIS